MAAGAPAPAAPTPPPPILAATGFLTAFDRTDQTLLFTLSPYGDVVDVDGDDFSPISSPPLLHIWF